MIKFLKKIKKEPANLKDVLARLKELEEFQEEILSKLNNSLQKVGIVRFNPFQENGGDQSFSVAVLDNSNNGFVITSHYGREANRVYAKPVSKGVSSYSLAKEEQEAIAQAMGQK